MNNKLSKEEREDRFMWAVVRSVIGLIAVLFLLFGLVFKQPCDSDAIFLSCRLTGTVADWVGSIIFLAGCFVLSGWPLVVFKGAKYLYTPINSNGYALIAGIGVLAGIILFWNL